MEVAASRANRILTIILIRVAVHLVDQSRAVANPANLVQVLVCLTPANQSLVQADLNLANLGSDWQNMYIVKIVDKRFDFELCSCVHCAISSKPHKLDRFQLGARYN